MSMRSAIVDILHGAMSKYEASLLRKLREDRLEERADRLPQRFPCGFTVYGNRIRYSLPHRLPDEDGTPVKDSLTLDDTVGHFIDGNVRLFTPGEIQTLSLMPQVLISHLHFMAFGPCTIQEVIVGNESASIWAGTTGMGAVWDPAVRIGNMVKVTIQAWEW